MIETVAFTDEHLEPAAGLVAARYRDVRAREPLLPPQFEDAGSVARSLERWWRVTSGFAALREGRVVGFMLGILTPIEDVETAWVSDICHAVAETEPRGLYHRLYARCAEVWIEHGCGTHHVTVLDGDTGARAELDALGFGTFSLDALRGLDSPVAANGDVVVRAADPELDFDGVMELARDLVEHLRSAPILLPLDPEPDADQRRSWLARPDHVMWLGFRDGRAARRHRQPAAATAGPGLFGQGDARHQLRLDEAGRAPQRRRYGARGACARARTRGGLPTLLRRLRVRERPRRPLLDRPGLPLRQPHPETAPRSPRPERAPVLRLAVWREPTGLPPLERVAVIGPPGAGKTTLARRLADRVGSEFVELDGLFWGPDWQQVPEDEFLASVAETLAGPRWVADGNYGEARHLVWARATTLVWLNYPFARTFARLVGRTVRRIRTREELFSGNRETFSETFLSKGSILWWAIKVHRRYQRDFPAALASGFDHLHVLEFRQPEAAEAFLAGVPDDAVAPRLE